MCKRNVTATIISTLVAGFAGQALAADVTLEYNLPEVKIGFDVGHTIIKCPDAHGKGFKMDTLTVLKPVYVRGELITVNPKGNLFVDRKVELEYYENHTLKSFNGSSAGQGGKLAAAVIKVATFAATTAIGVPLPVSAVLMRPGLATDPLFDIPRPRSIQCKASIATLIHERESAEAHLATLKQILQTQGASADLLRQITRTEAAIADIISRLTVTADPLIWKPTTEETGFTKDLPRADLTVWFDTVSEEDLQREFYRVGFGQIRAFEAVGAIVTSPGTMPASNTSYADLGFPIKGLVYRVPRRIKVTLKPKADFDAPASLGGLERALARAAHTATKAEATVEVPQLGELKVIPFDGSGMFGSRQVTATFSQAGELTSVGYSTNGGADALAGIGDALVASGTELREAKLNALKRDVEYRTKEKELEDLIDAAADPAG